MAKQKITRHELVLKIAGQHNLPENLVSHELLRVEQSVVDRSGYSDIVEVLNNVGEPESLGIFNVVEQMFCIIALKREYRELVEEIARQSGLSPELVEANLLNSAEGKKYIDNCILKRNLERLQ